MKEVSTAISIIIVVSILFIAVGNWQLELSREYGMSYTESDFRLANTTKEMQVLSEDIQQDVEKFTMPTSSIGEKASGFIGAGMNFGRFILNIPRIFMVVLSEITGVSQLGIGQGGEILLLVGLGITTIFLIALIILWRKGGVL